MKVNEGIFLGEGGAEILKAEGQSLKSKGCGAYARLRLEVWYFLDRLDGFIKPRNHKE